MKIIKVQALRGPNIWSIKEKINPNAIGWRKWNNFQPIK
jgi:hypothetical protein